MVSPVAAVLVHTSTIVSVLTEISCCDEESEEQSDRNLGQPATENVPIIRPKTLFFDRNFNN